MLASTSYPVYSPQEYLALERGATVRSEYLDGQILAMSGASRAHNLIAGNTYREVARQFKGRSCEVYMSDMRVKAGPGDLYTYPDVVAVCGMPRFEDELQDTLLNPSVLVEVLSRSTEAYDRGEKFARYRRLESLQEYLLLAQDRVRAEHYLRQGARWILSEASSLGDILELAAIGCRLALSEVYDKIEVAGS